MNHSIWAFCLLCMVAIVGCNKPADEMLDTSQGPGQDFGDFAAGGAVNETGAAGGTDPVPLTDGTADLVAENTSIGFTGTKPDGTAHSGGFAELTGGIKVDADKPTSISVEVQTESIWSDAQKLTDHLKSPDFFNVREHPTMTFNSTSIETGDEEGTYNVSGELTMLGTTKAISFPAKVSVSDRGLTLQSDFEIDRTQFGMTYGEGQVDSAVKLNVMVGAGSPGEPAESPAPPEEANE